MKLKRTIVSKDIYSYKLNRDILDTHHMKAGDLGVFEVIELGRHEFVQMADGRNRGIFPGDKLIATFADRYASSQFEGYVPEEPKSLYHILGAGGVIGIVRSKNYSL